MFFTAVWQAPYTQFADLQLQTIKRQKRSSSNPVGHTLTAKPSSEVYNMDIKVSLNTSKGDIYLELSSP